MLLKPAISQNLNYQNWVSDIQQNFKDSKVGKEKKERDIESNYIPNTVQNKQQKIELFNKLFKHL